MSQKRIVMLMSQRRKLRKAFSLYFLCKAENVKPNLAKQVHLFAHIKSRKSVDKNIKPMFDKATIFL